MIARLNSSLESLAKWIFVVLLSSQFFKAKLILLFEISVAKTLKKNGAKASQGFNSEFLYKNNVFWQFMLMNRFSHNAYELHLMSSVGKRF